MPPSYLDLLRKYAKVAFAFVCHLGLIAISILGIFGLEHLFHYLWGETEPLLFGRVPLRWMFEAVDIAIIALYAYRFIREANEILRG